MIADRLRQSVLEAAISGKLTEQHPADGTGAELAELIAEARKELFNTSKPRKAKALPANDVVFRKWEIPETWKWAILDDVTIPADNRNPEDTGRQDIKYIDIGSVPGPTRLLDDVEGIEAATAPSRARQVVKGGDTVFSTVRPYLEKIAFIDPALDDEFASTGYCVLRPIEPIRPEYIFYFAVSRILLDQVLPFQKGVGYPAVTDREIKSSRIPLPPLAEQERIVKRLDEILPLIDQLAELESERESLDDQFVKALERAILQAAVSGHLTTQTKADGNAQDLLTQIAADRAALVAAGKLKRQKPLPPVTPAEEPYPIPPNWAWTRLGEMGSFAGGKTPSMDNPDFWSPATVPWVTSKDMKSERIYGSQMLISEEGSKQLTIYQPGTVLMVTRSGILAHTFPVSVLEVPATINQDLKAYSLYKLEMGRFIQLVLKGLSPIILTKYAKRGTTVQSIKFDEFSTQMPVPLPPPPEQSRIAEKLDLLLPLVNSLRVE